MKYPGGLLLENKLLRQILRRFDARRRGDGPAMVVLARCIVHVDKGFCFIHREIALDRPDELSMLINMNRVRGRRLRIGFVLDISRLLRLLIFGHYGPSRLGLYFSPLSIEIARLLSTEAYRRWRKSDRREFSFAAGETRIRRWSWTRIRDIINPIALATYQRSMPNLCRLTILHHAVSLKWL